MEIHQSRWIDFKKALYQFTMPVVSIDAWGNQVRMEGCPSFLSQVDSSILSELDGPRIKSHTTSLLSSSHNGLHGMRCRNVGVVPRPLRPDPLPQQRKPSQTKQRKEVVPAPRPSSSLQKRTLLKTSSGGNQRNVSQKTEYFNELKNKCEYFSGLS
jgi:hypothetical protein